MRRSAALVLLALALGAKTQPARAVDTTFGGHAKYRFTATGIPADSALRGVTGDPARDHGGEFRLVLDARQGRWAYSAHAQLIALKSDMLAIARTKPAFSAPAGGVINDRRRWFDLTHDLHDEGDEAAVVRIDRLAFGYTGDRTVLRFGRQAVSWGNSLLFTPLDIFNPFDPATVDREYKTGDDMLYGQYLFDDGADLQAVGVVRREIGNGDVSSDVSSLALKYHGFAGATEYDLLAARHYDETLFGLGLAADLGGAVWRGDLAWADTGRGGTWSAVFGVSYSWVWGGRNWTGLTEYFHNGFGQRNGAYAPADLARNPDLLKRLARGELFSLGRRHVGVSATVELTPLLQLSQNLFVNLDDPSAFAQVVLNVDLRQDMRVLAALNVPVGPRGTEYGGIPVSRDAAYLETGAALFAQVAWYF